MIFEILTYDEVTSTMTVAAALRNSKTVPYCVQAHRQMKGYGRNNRVWNSEGKNLYATLVFQPHAPLKHWYQLAFVSAVAVHRTIQFFLKPLVATALKWPNDVLIEGKKVAGILIETHSDDPGTIYIGIGINVHDSPFDYTTFLAAWLNKPTLEIEEVLKALLGNFHMVYTLWQKEGFHAIMKVWRDYGPLYGSSITFQHKEALYKGAFEHVDDQGMLHLKTANGIKTFRSGDILMPYG